MQRRYATAGAKIDNATRRAGRLAARFALFLVTVLAFEGSAFAITIFVGGDDAGPGDARPNADAARDDFINAASALGAVDIIDFEDLAVTTDLVVGLTPTVTATWTGVTTAFQGTISDQDGKALGFNTTPAGQLHGHIDPNSADARMTFDFDQPIVAWGAYVTGIASVGGEVRVLFDDGSMQSILLNGAPGGGVSYIGFTDLDNPIDQVVIASLEGDDSIGVDDIAFVTPEPATVVGAVFGLPLVGFLAWRRRRPR